MSSFLLSRYLKFGNQFVICKTYFHPAGNDIAFKSYLRNVQIFRKIPQIYPLLHQHNFISEKTILYLTFKCCQICEFQLQLFSIFFFSPSSEMNDLRT